MNIPLFHSNPPVMVTFELHPELRLVVVTMRGTVTDAELCAAYERLYQDHRWRPDFAELVDARHANPSGVTAKGLLAVANLVEAALGDSKAPYKTAILITADLGYGLARMYEAYVEDSPETVRVFRDIGPALHWLEAPGDLLEE